MILPLDRELWISVEKYNKVFDDVVSQPLKPIKSFSISINEHLSKKEFSEVKLAIEEHILKLLDEINDIESFCLSLFVYRTVLKNYMYSDFNTWTPYFKACNILFFFSLKYKKERSGKIIRCSNDRKYIKDIYLSAYTIIYNQSIFNEQYYVENKQFTYDFYNRIDVISNKTGDLHSYQIVNDNLQNYLVNKQLSIENIRNNALSKYKEYYLQSKELENSSSWKKMISGDNIANPQDDIIIIHTCDFDKYDQQLQALLTTFETIKCKCPMDTESELIFTYKTDRYYYISKKILHDAQMIVEDSITWSQYDNITRYFFNFSIDQKILRNYNRLMTYKIVDLLLLHGYITPMENSNGLIIPRIEISNYSIDKVAGSKLGDIDVIFYSEFTQILYLVEFKNYQMMVSREGDLSSEVSKVERENTPQKVSKRRNYVIKNIKHCCSELFKTEHEIKETKSIILTTKPCYYFFINQSDEYDYMDWVEFEEKVSKKVL